MSHLPSPRRDLNRRGGFTLLEVVIALAIFVFGALAIVRIFPPALGIIQNSGDQLVATNLNRSTLARLAKSPNILPDATYDSTTDENAANWPTLPRYTAGSVVGSGRRNNSVPIENLQDFDKSALKHFRNIAGERYTIPSDGMVLTQFPFEAGSLKVYKEEDLIGVTLDSTGILNFSKAHRASDPNTIFSPDITVAIPTDRVYVTYQWTENGRVWSQTDEALDYSSSSTAPKVAQTGRTEFTSGTVVLIDSEVKARVRSELAVTPVSTNNNLGLIDFDTTDSNTAVGKQVALDYIAKDWRWLVQDGVPNVPTDGGTPTERTVNLAVRPFETQSPYLYTFLKNTGNTTPPTPTPTPEIKDETTINPAYFTRKQQKAGQVIFQTNGYIAPVSRIVYKALDNWAQQLSVAPPDYKLFYGRTRNQDWEYWRDCVQIGNFLYFKPSEAGKVVSLTYTYEDPLVLPATNRNASNDIRVRDQILPIRTDFIKSADVAGLPVNFDVNGFVCRLDLTDKYGNPLGTPLTSIQSIQGISVQARTAWLDGDRFTQALATSYRGASNQ